MLQTKTSYQYRFAIRLRDICWKTCAEIRRLSCTLVLCSVVYFISILREKGGVAGKYNFEFVRLSSLIIPKSPGFNFPKLRAKFFLCKWIFNLLEITSGSAKCNGVFLLSCQRQDFFKVGKIRRLGICLVKMKMSIIIWKRLKFLSKSFLCLIHILKNLENFIKISYLFIVN